MPKADDPGHSPGQRKTEVGKVQLFKFSCAKTIKTVLAFLSCSEQALAMSADDQGPWTSQGGAQFPTTHWSVVLAAGESSSPATQAALEQLSRTYWYPLYVYVRRRGSSPVNAQDLTQGFFSQPSERD